MAVGFFKKLGKTLKAIGNYTVVPIAKGAWYLVKKGAKPLIRTLAPAAALAAAGYGLYKYPAAAALIGTGLMKGASIAGKGLKSAVTWTAGKAIDATKGALDGLKPKTGLGVPLVSGTGGQKFIPVVSELIPYNGNTIDASTVKQLIREPIGESDYVVQPVLETDAIANAVKSAMKEAAASEKASNNNPSMKESMIRSLKDLGTSGAQNMRGIASDIIDNKFVKMLRTHRAPRARANALERMSREKAAANQAIDTAANVVSGFDPKDGITTNLARGTLSGGIAYGAHALGEALKDSGHPWLGAATKAIGGTFGNLVAGPIVNATGTELQAASKYIQKQNEKHRKNYDNPADRAWLTVNDAPY